MMIKTFGTAVAIGKEMTQKQRKTATGARIKRMYSIEDQLNVMREAIAKIGGGGKAFEDMHAAINAELNDGRNRKQMIARKRKQK